MMIPHSRLTISPEDSQFVARVVESGRVAQGAAVREFEAAVASYVGVKGGVAVSSGTSALHVALIAMGVGVGDEVVLPSYLCVAPLNAIHYVGATPVLADVNPATGNISPESVRQMINKRTKVIIVPHMMGMPAEIETLRSLGVPLLEDCAQSIGALFKGRQTGSFGTAAICSFYATKVFACGEGGMVLSNDAGILDAVRDLRDYDEKTPYKVRYNYKMTDIQAALGISQLKKLPEFIAARRKIASIYDSEFAGSTLDLPVKDIDCEPISFRYVLRIKQGVDNFISNMQGLNIVCRRAIYKPLHVLLGQPALKQTDTLYHESVSIPIYPTLTVHEQEQIIAAIKKIVQ